VKETNITILASAKKKKKKGNKTRTKSYKLQRITAIIFVIHHNLGKRHTKKQRKVRKPKQNRISCKE
jgi:DNA polymerase III delta subunit